MLPGQIAQFSPNKKDVKDALAVLKRYLLTVDVAENFFIEIISQTVRMKSKNPNGASKAFHSFVPCGDSLEAIKVSLAED